MAATSCHLLNHLHLKGLPLSISKPGTSNATEKYMLPTKGTKLGRKVAGRTLCFIKFGASPNIEFTKFNMNPLQKLHDIHSVAEDLKEPSDAISNLAGRMVLLGDLDPATAKLAIGLLGPFLSAVSFLFIVRIVMSWYPKLPVGKFPYVLAYAPTEPILVVTRKLIPPLGGVDVTPVVWFGLISFLNEILVGPQGLLVLLSQQVS
ncbi:protein COFACTOR ASSEMBLY OF COMPLEX C SUBUNIT B CCB3, chloroplastic [Humulus lupulus]|uniref:protein COFACTOR ASSEMBLY OF COMPLEX C SUBUNIT B CCB3, chloroplastic n=1 Tax=Humulus lupulus TaxID=3486 RepID=UPI002B40F821|nr:protein COFACTOR ASSEMBLY OF COMPLEX C SUBUNIT B CCB3, chloroplastic [Humulus lupulus]